MSEQPTLRIKGKTYEYPAGSKLGDAALIERLTGLTHAEWRTRYRQSLEVLTEIEKRLEEDETLDESEFDSLEEDSAISIGIVAMAVARANRRWSRTQIVEFVNDLDWDEVEYQKGETAVPLEAGEESSQTATGNGNDSASQSSSDSDTGSSESETPLTSGTPTSPTSPEAPSDQTT